ncbi:outer-membrane lipoprotein carrier protein precursor [mine drainage metagenome]|uniref:Outer-membrane lipoprotein carrier protein n=1 Tax=mine drainage metagenome TaxID=410659 RepID=A0A1J5QFG6_9ZZZZ
MQAYRRRFVLALACAAAAPLPAMAAPADGVALLRSWLRDTRSGRADFIQQLIDAKGAHGAVSRGQFVFERPGRFRWSYSAPYRQDIVSDGSTIWTYDHDLDQVTLTRASSALAGTPAALLAGADIDAVFKLAPQAAADGLQWVQATPRGNDSSFAWVRIGLRDGAHGPELVRMQLRDAFRRTSDITFSAQQRNPSLPPATFQFAIPAGAAVLDQR